MARSILALVTDGSKGSSILGFFHRDDLKELIDYAGSLFARLEILEIELDGSGRSNKVWDNHKQSERATTTAWKPRPQGPATFARIIYTQAQSWCAVVAMYDVNFSSKEILAQFNALRASPDRPVATRYVLARIELTNNFSNKDVTTEVIG